MEHDFWLERWQKSEIGFHEKEVNPALKEHYGVLGLQRSDSIFVPLCGKTRDIGWLLDRGLKVTGAELSALAVSQLFEELALTPEIKKEDDFTCFKASNLTIWQGDIFQLKRQHIGEIDAVYDRAALVALPADMRPDYAAHLLNLTAFAPQLLVCLEYDPSCMNGPPFSVTSQDVHTYYAQTFTIDKLDSVDVAGGIKGKCPGKSVIWHLRHA